MDDLIASLHLAALSAVVVLGLPDQAWARLYVKAALLVSAAALVATVVLGSRRRRAGRAAGPDPGTGIARHARLGDCRPARSDVGGNVRPISTAKGARR